MTETKTQNAAPAGSQPGNLSTRQLASSLIKIIPATDPVVPSSDGAGTDEENTAAEVDPLTTTREATSAEDGGESAEAARTEEEEQGAGSGEQEAQELPPEGGAPEEAADAAPEPAQGGLPVELADAIELAKGDGKKGVAKLLQRVHSLVDDRDTERNARLAASEENKQLRAELIEARSKEQGAGRQTNGSPNGWTNPEVAAVAQELSNVDHWIGWCEANPDGGQVPDGKGGQVELTATQVSKVQRDLANQRQELVARKVHTEGAAKAAYQQLHQKFHAQAVQEFPWINDAKSPEYQEMQAVIKLFPAFKQSPDYEVAIGDYLAGKQLREARTAARGNGSQVRRAAAPRIPTKVLADPPAGRGRVEDPVEKGKKEAEGKFRKTGRTADLAQTFAANRRASR